MTAEYQVNGDVAVITLNNPPVNGLGLSTRLGITDGLALAMADAAVKAIELGFVGHLMDIDLAHVVPFSLCRFAANVTFRT